METVRRRASRLAIYRLRRRRRPTAANRTGARAPRSGDHAGGRSSALWRSKGRLRVTRRRHRRLPPQLPDWSASSSSGSVAALERASKNVEWHGGAAPGDAENNACASRMDLRHSTLYDHIGATLGDLREAVTTLEALNGSRGACSVARAPATVIEGLRDAQAALHARETRAAGGHAR